MTSWWERRRGEVTGAGGGEEEQARGGPYVGFGPKGYERSDERIREDVCDRMTAHGQLDARGITVEVKGGQVWLRGEVDSRTAKRLAENIADRVPGVVDVHNRLRIVSLKGRGDWALAAAKAREGQAGIDWRSKLHAGMPVIGADGNRVGEVKEVRENDFVVNRRLARDLSIPFGLIDNIKEETVMLVIRSDQVGHITPENMQGYLASPYEDKTLSEHS